MEYHLRIINLDHIEDPVCVLVDEVHANREKYGPNLHSFRISVSVFDPPD